METRASKVKMDRVKRKLNFDYMFCVEPRGLSGGLSLLWKSNTNINVYEWCDNYIKANININNDLNWQGIFVYGNPVFQKRRKLWQELTVSNMNQDVAQAFLGDFNDILNQDEKVGIHPQPNIYLETFRRFVHDNGLIDIDLKGNKYTWFSNPRNNVITRERLDRVLVNWKWMQIHQNVTLRASPAITSDHCALILDTQRSVRIKKEFRFEAYWAEHKECREVIKRSWQREDGNSNCWNQFKIKRNRCKRELLEWSTRNQHIFQQTEINPQKVIIQSDYLSAEFYKATQGSTTAIIPDMGRGGVRKRITWRPPPKNRLKVNTDAAFHKDTGQASLAAVVRDWQGKVITGTTGTFKTISPLTAEAQAYREALILIKNLQIHNCIIETDSLPLVQAIKARTPIAEADAVMRDIFQLLDEAPDVGATWTPRDGNKLAHQLAAMTAGNYLARQWVTNPPNQVRNIIRSEATLVSCQHIQETQILGIKTLASNNSISTNLQNLQLEEKLPGGVEMETRDKQPLNSKEKLCPSAVNLATIDSRKTDSDRTHNDRRGGEVDRAESQMVVCQEGGHDGQPIDAPQAPQQLHGKAIERGVLRGSASGRRTPEAELKKSSEVRQITGLNQQKTLRIRDAIAIGESRSSNQEHAPRLEGAECRDEVFVVKEGEDQAKKSLKRVQLLPEESNEATKTPNDERTPRRLTKEQQQ
ncbi:hypothetical protein Ahy_A04g018094 [Arachis hypogaea]|uniref:RNase H type-1 domain-containing protein n=1 Tax=Arachis hypogaea TaxID=3818 RepID=A0A445DCW5_ARAHY|nr:hypothetical protein Ahy_A04g018094 [Arachis hypogaea]